MTSMSDNNDTHFETDTVYRYIAYRTAWWGFSLLMKSVNLFGSREISGLISTIMTIL